MDSCIFCKIIKGDISAEKIFESEHSLAFLDVTPRAPGHTMVVPKTHAETLLQLPKDNVGPFFEDVQTVIGMIKKALSPDAFTLGMNHGRVSGQEVNHMHFHILPRWAGDGGHSFQSVVSNPPKEGLAAIAQKIRNSK